MIESNNSKQIVRLIKQRTFRYSLLFDVIFRIILEGVSYIVKLLKKIIAKPFYIFTTFANIK